MKYLLQFSIIGCITFIAELISFFVPLPVPAGIYGLLLLFVLLLTGVVKPEWLEQTADFLLAVMPIMFVPAAVGLMTKWELIKDSIVGLMIATIVSTGIVMAVSGLVTQWIIQRRRGK